MVQPDQPVPTANGLRIPAVRLLGDSLLGLFGVTMGLGGLLLGPASLVLAVLSAAIAAAGGWFLWRSWRLARLRLRLDPTGLAWRYQPLAAGRASSAPDWQAATDSNPVVAVRLRHFAGVRAAKQGGGEGQLTLRLKAGQRLFVDSRLEQFERLVAVLARHHQKQPFTADPRTRACFQRYGTRLTDPAAAPDQQSPEA